MGARSGVGLKAIQWFLRGIEFCCAAIVLGLFSYFLATLHNHSLHIPTYVRAVEGLSGAAVLYTLLGLLLLCCLAGHVLASLIAIVLDICFIGAFIYIAQANRGGAGSCRGVVNTPFGSGQSGSTVSDGGHGGFTHLPTFFTACRMTTACLAVSIVAVIFFLFSAIMEVILLRHHRKEKRFGPGPQNNYTSGYGRRKGLFGWRGRRRGTGDTTGTNPNALPQHTHPSDVRDSYATETTAVGAERPSHTYNKPGETGYGAGTDAMQHNAANPTAPAQYPAGNYRYEDGVYNS